MKKRENKCKVLETTNRIMELEDKLVAEIENNNTLQIQEIGDKIKESKKIIEEHIETETRGAALRNRCIWHEYGDTNSKFFLNLEKSKATQKCISRLRGPTGETITERKEILDKEFNFYNHLYKSKTEETKLNHKENTEKENMFHVQGPIIEDEDHDLLVNDIEEKEIWEIIQSSPLTKAWVVTASQLNFTRNFGMTSNTI